MVDAPDDKPSPNNFYRDHFERIEQGKKRVAESRNTAIDGKKIASYLITIGNEATRGRRSSSKKNMFNEILTRCAFDVTGDAHFINSSGTKYNGLDEVFKVYAEEKESIHTRNTSQGKNFKNQEPLPYSYNDTLDKSVLANKSESPYAKTMQCIPLYKKGMVQTPHPTEMLGEEAVKAELALHEQITVLAPKLMQYAKNGTKLSNEDKGALVDKCTALFTTMAPVSKPLTIEDEIKRSIEFSELSFDAVPHMIAGIIDPARRHGLRNSQPLTMEELRHFANLIEASTWSPGDRDSKPDMTAKRLQEGVDRNRHMMALKYAIELAKIIPHIELKDEPYITTSEGRVRVDDRATVKKDLEKMIARILAGLPEDVRPSTKPLPLNKDGKLNDNSPLGDKMLEHYFPRKDGTTTEYDKLIRNNTHTAEPPFGNREEMWGELERIRNFQQRGIIFPPYPFAPGNDGTPSPSSAIINKVDVLIAQMHNFGNYALRPQIRENALMHEGVMKQVCKELGITGNSRKARVQNLLETLSTKNGRKKCHQTIKTILKQKSALRKDLEAQIDASKDSDKISALDKTLKPVRDLYETLAGMEVATTHPDAIKQYLIAECRDSTDILEAFALVKLMEPLTPNPLGSVEIVPLVEHRKDVANAAKMIKEAYDNKLFFEHHREIGASNPSIMHEKYSNMRLPYANMTVEPGGTLKHRPYTENLTVAEVKKMYDMYPRDKNNELIIPERDKHRKINHAKMMMFAGSDIMKSAGPAGAAMTQHAIADLREKMLDMETPVLLIDYTGTGGGLHRSQPASTSFETVQGRSMRTTPWNIAQKALTTMSEFVKRVLDMRGSGEQLQMDVGKHKSREQKRDLCHLAQLNLGNMAAFPPDEESWHKDGGSGKRCDAAIDKYEELYHSAEFACMMAYSADKFAKATSYAARPAKRVTGKSDTGNYPPVVDVSELRAIGYGTALNVSGSCASYYYGMSEFLKADEILASTDGKALNELFELYQHDTRTQDAINRATFGIVMADLHAAWTYVGMERTVEGEKVHVKNFTKLTDNKSRSVEELATSKTINRINVEEIIQTYNSQPTKDAKMEYLGTLNNNQKKALAIQALAKVEVEYEKVSKILLKLHSLASGKIVPPVSFNTIQENIRERLPTVLASQMDASIKNMGTARQDLADMFHDSLSSVQMKEPHFLHGEPKDIRQHKDFPEIYYRMGVCNECFENAPRAYTRPWWGMRADQKQEQAATR